MKFEMPQQSDRRIVQYYTSVFTIRSPDNAFVVAELTQCKLWPMSKAEAPVVRIHWHVHHQAAMLFFVYLSGKE